MKNSRIFEYLNELNPNPKPELIYNKDYELLIAVMLSAQSTDKRVNEVTKILFGKYPSLDLLSSAKVEDIMDIIRSVGTYTRKAKYVLDISNKLLEIGGKVPNDRDFLESLSGVGRKTANVVLSVLFNEPYMAVDTHIERVSKRLGFASMNDSVYEVEQKLYKIIPKKMMYKLHHQLLLFGRYHCKAINPNCINCKIRDLCNEKRKRLS